jgi:hypothetical protein
MRSRNNLQRPPRSILESRKCTSNRQVRGLAVFEVTQGCTCCVLPTLNIALRVEFMARQVPSQAENVTHDLFVTLLSRCHFAYCINSLKPVCPLCPVCVCALKMHVSHHTTSAPSGCERIYHSCGCCCRWSWCDRLSAPLCAPLFGLRVPPLFYLREAKQYARTRGVL